MEEYFCRNCGTSLGTYDVPAKRKVYCSNKCRLAFYDSEKEFEKRRRKERVRSKAQTIAGINELARACGMTYGQYVATHRNGG